MKMQNPNQEPSAPIKALNQDLKDMDILFTFEHWYPLYVQVQTPSQEPPVFSKTPIQDKTFFASFSSIQKAKIQNAGQ